MKELKIIVNGRTTRWFWMMDYCKKYGLPPAQQWAWKRAGDACTKKFPNGMDN